MKPAENYILSKPEPFRSILMHIKSVIELTIPEADLKFKWKVPFYYIGKSPLCYLNQTKNYVDVAFSKAHMLSNYNKYLIADGRKIIRSLRYKNLHEIDDTILIEILEQAKKNRNQKFWKQA